MQTGISSICGGCGCFGPEGILLEACASAGAAVLQLLSLSN